MPVEVFEKKMHWEIVCLVEPRDSQSVAENCICRNAAHLTATFSTAAV